MEAKTRWFRSLPMAERMEIFCCFTDLALSINPRLKDRNVFKSFQRHEVRLLELPDQEDSAT
jgi:hypothetical protein